MTIEDLFQQVSSDLFIAKVNDKLYLINDYNLGDENFDYGIYDTCKVGDSKNLQIPENYIDNNFIFLEEDDMPCHYGMSKEEIKIITEEYHCDWADKALELGYKGFYNTEKDICNYLKGTLILDEFTEDELKTFENVSDYVLECIKNYEESIEW